MVLGISFASSVFEILLSRLLGYSDALALMKLYFV